MENGSVSLAAGIRAGYYPLIILQICAKTLRLATYVLGLLEAAQRNTITDLP